jgi:hypothetical protein
MNARIFNSVQKNTHLGLTKMLADSSGIKRSHLTDEEFNHEAQSLEISGTKEFCLGQKQMLEGLDEDKIRNLMSNTDSQTILQRAGKKISSSAEELKGKGWEYFVQAMRMQGIFITLDIYTDLDAIGQSISKEEALEYIRCSSPTSHTYPEMGDTKTCINCGKTVIELQPNESH